MIEYKHKLHVYYRDVDQMGIVYYTRYLEYFEEARTELLRSVGIDVTEFEKMGYYFPVVSCNCEYKYSAKFDEKLLILTKLNDLPRSTLKIDYQVYNSENKLLVVGNTVHSFMNIDGRAVKPPRIFIEKIKG